MEHYIALKQARLVGFGIFDGCYTCYRRCNLLGCTRLFCWHDAIHSEAIANKDHRNKFFNETLSTKSEHSWRIGETAKEEDAARHLIICSEEEFSQMSKEYAAVRLRAVVCSVCGEKVFF